MDLTIDFETRSEIDLKQSGIFVYWSHPSTIPLCLSLKVNDEAPVYWVSDYFQRKFNPDSIPYQQISFVHVAQLIKDADRIIAHNAMFEFLGLNTYMRKRYGLAPVRLEKMYDTMSQLAYHALPLNLEQGCLALNLPIQKDSKGHAVMMKLTKPRTPRKAEREANPEWGSTVYWHEDPADIEAVINYCCTDVNAERLIERSLAPLPDRERKIWLMDQRINMRGVPIDIESVRAVVHGVNAYDNKHRIRFNEIVVQYPFKDGSILSSPLYHVGVKNWVIEQTGFKLTSIDKDATAALLKRKDIPAHVRDVLEIRSQLSKSSVSKLTAMLDRANDDGRVRGWAVYHAATTGRWASWRPQFHNQVRTSYKPEKYEQVVELYKKGLTEAVEVLHDQIYTSASKCVRGSIATNDKNEFFCTDFSSIEGRGLAYLAKEEWVLEAYRQNEDMYKHAAAMIFGCTYADIGDESKERQVGKVSELALGYGGGIGAYASMAKGYGIDLETLPPLILPRATYEELEGDYGAKALAKMYIKKNPAEMSYEAAIACDVIKRKWRAARVMICRFWKSIQECAIRAVENPGQIFEYLDLKYVVHNKFLMCLLPSGRILHYYLPRLSTQDTDWGQSTAITYMGVRVEEGKSGRQWTRLVTYGGKLTENCISGEAEILTRKGWAPLITYYEGLEVWDGLSFVKGGPLLDKGIRCTISYLGVDITTDHLVLMKSGWKDIRYALQIEGTGLDEREKVRLPNNDKTYGPKKRSWVKVMVCKMRLRTNNYSSRIRDDTFPRSRPQVLRMYDFKHDCQSSNHSWNVTASGVCSVALYDRSVSFTYASSVEKLWRAGNTGLQKMASFFRKFLEGYGADLSTGFNFRPKKQQWGLYFKKLSLGLLSQARKQQTLKHGYSNSVGGNNGCSGVSKIRNKYHHALLSLTKQLADKSFIYKTRPDKQNKQIRVFDIQNCGPRNRFVIRGKDKVPFIVHNCVQAFCRDILADAMLRHEAAGYPVILHVHDEDMAEVPAGKFDFNDFNRLAEIVPPYAVGMPIKAKGWIGRRYRK